MIVHPKIVQANLGEEQTPVVKKHPTLKKSMDIIVNSSLVIIVGAIVAGTLVFAFNYDNVVFALRRPDMIDAARTVEKEEQKSIQTKIAEAKKETIQKMLSPLVFNETK